MKNTPPDWPRISSCLYYEDPAAAIEWLCKAFGFSVRLKIEGEDGAIHHSELVYGGGVVMVSAAGKKLPGSETSYGTSPRAIAGGNTQNMMVYVDDVEEHCKRARAAGATITIEPKTTDYGEDYWTDRSYGACDVEGHNWWFSQRLRDPKPK